jgi:hypothetical protein
MRITIETDDQTSQPRITTSGSGLAVATAAQPRPPERAWVRPSPLSVHGLAAAGLSVDVRALPGIPVMGWGTFDDLYFELDR